MGPVAPIRLTTAGDAPYGLIASAREAARGTITVAIDPGPDSELATPGAQETRQVRWAGGVNIVPDPCGGGTVVDPCGDTGGEDPTNPDTIGPHIPLPIVASVDCSTFGSSIAERQARALRKLRGVRSFQLEREFWAGAGAQAAGYTDNEWLTKAGSDLIDSGNAMGIDTAFAELEQAIADGSSWEVGMIHAQPRLVTHWAQQGLVTRTGNILVSALGTIVVPGRGYPNLGPTGHDPGSPDFVWAFATSLVYVFLGPEVPQAEGVQIVNPTTNLIAATAVQDAMAVWDGCIWAAALVDTTVERTDVGS